MLKHKDSSNHQLFNPFKNEKLTSQDQKNQKARNGKYFIIILIAINILIYIIYTYEFLYKSLIPSHPFLFTILFFTYHLIVILLILSFWKTVNLFPGTIPPYWGFYIGDDESKRKRYCLICNCFKPERTHHCSICNICILNMDHHCPWVNNCIGFYNRKFFLQLLGYTCIYSIYIACTLIYFVYEIIRNVIEMKMEYNDIVHGCLVVVLFGFSVVFLFINGKFFKFHIELVLNNSTTIESLDKEHKEENKLYNVGVYENWIQVFGENKFFWFLPIDAESGRPCGEGLTWKKKNEGGETVRNNKGEGGNHSLESNHPTTERETAGRKKIELANILHNNVTNYSSTSPMSP